MDICTKGHTKRRACKKNRNWHRRPNLRKSVVQPPAMQGRDKNGPKEIAKKWEQTGAWPPSKEPPQEARATNDDGGTLRFPCSRCEDNSAYAPKDLMNHFVEKHRGSVPVFSCHMCTFCTHEFSYLQVHLLSHKDTFSSCSMCNDNVQRTWPEFSAHLAMRHCTDGRYSCETCKKFSTCDFRVFLEHIYEHNLNVEEVEGLQPPSAQSPCCKFCGFEAPEKWLINKHVRAAHVCQNGNQRDDGRQARSMATKPNDPSPRVKTRLTRSTDRTACWLTPDCLSLPGKEFLDKYCHLSDPQTTLEETQQFLMQSVVGETDDQKWTKALKSALQKNTGNGIAADTSDVAILTVKNNITMSQNSATYPKRLKTSSGNKEAVCPEGADCDPLVGNQNRFDLNLKNQAPCLPCNGFSPSGTGTQENRENNKLEMDSEIQENIQKLEEPRDSAGFCKLSDLKLTNESEERTSAGGVPTNGKMQKRRRRRKARFKKVQRRPEGGALKMVIKKNVVKGKRWVPQSSSSPKEEIRDQLELPNPPPVEDVQSVRCVDQNCIQGSQEDSPSLLKQTAICEFVLQRNPEDATTENESDLLGSLPSTHREIQDVAAKPQDLSGESGSAEGTGKTDPAATSATDQGTAGEEPQKSHRGADGEATEEKTSPAAVTPHGELGLDSCVECPAEQRNQIIEELRREEVPADSGPHFLSGVRLPQGETNQQESSPAARPQQQLVPKHQQRTLRLVAINPSQPVKRPAGDQPVVVLNHPDADVPQVARIMEVVNKYREVRKVLLSRRTLRALSAPETDDPTEDQGESRVQERFALRLKFRRVSRKKYEVAGVVSPEREAVSRFSCWFCGRVFSSQQEMMVHRQRHLMDWKKPDCQKS